MAATSFAVFAQGNGNYNAYDIYDLAVGALSAPNSLIVMNFSGDVAYDLAADGQPAETPVRYVRRFSGDDDSNRQC